MPEEVMITDSHCHLASHRFADEDVSVIIERARAAGIQRMVTLASWQRDNPIIA
jgi:TatD DNase family protein